MANKRLVLVAAIAVCAGCATPYQQMGFRGGYDQNQISPGLWSVRVEVNSYTGADTALEYAYRRAAELCRDGFDVVGGTQQQNDFYMRVGDAVANRPKTNLAIIARCRVSIADAPRGPQPSLPDESWWCADSTRFGIGGCFRARADCVKYVVGMKNTDPAFAECQPLGAAVCYSKRMVSQNSIVAQCAPTAAECRTARDFEIANPSPDFDHLGECEAKR